MLQALHRLTIYSILFLLQLSLSMTNQALRVIVIVTDNLYSLCANRAK